MIGEFLFFIRDIRSLLQAFREDGFIHLLMAPLFTYGIGFGLALFVVAFLLKENKCRTLALLLVLGCSALYYPYQHKRNEGAPRPGYHAYWTVENQKLWDDQTTRRRHFQYVYFLLAGVTFLNLLISPSGLFGKIIGLGVLGIGTFVLVCGLWLNLYEKRIFHPDLRKAPEVRGPITLFLEDTPDAERPQLPA